MAHADEEVSFSGAESKEAQSAAPGHDVAAARQGVSQDPDPDRAKELERWNEPRSNLFRFLVTLYSFIIMGMNDGAVGVSALHSTCGCTADTDMT